MSSKQNFSEHQFPPSPQSDLFNYLRPEQQEFLKPILRVLKKPAQEELCCALLDYLETGIPEPPVTFNLGVIFMYIIHGCEPKVSDPDDRKFLYPLRQKDEGLGVKGEGFHRPSPNSLTSHLSPLTSHLSPLTHHLLYQTDFQQVKTNTIMIKKSYQSVRLDCIMQSEELNSESCPMGVMSFNPEDSTFRFEEAAKRHRPSRNLKLYEGDYVSIVHMQNGKYQCHMKTLNASGITDRESLAFQIYTELLNAFKVMD